MGALVALFREMHRRTFVSQSNRRAESELSRIELPSSVGMHVGEEEVLGTRGLFLNSFRILGNADRRTADVPTIATAAFARAAAATISTATSKRVAHAIAAFRR